MNVHVTDSSILKNNERIVLLFIYVRFLLKVKTDAPVFISANGYFQPH
jgi:hypothetical protein